MDITILLLTTLLTAFVSLIGGFLLLGKSRLAALLNRLGKPFAIVVLLYSVFFDLLPESLESGALSLPYALALTFSGLFLCTLISYLVGHFHRHGEAKELKSKTEAYAMLIIDSLHTLVDGVVLGLAFAASLGTGLLAAVSTAAHEIPQEIGDFGIMLRSKMSKKRILQLQIISSLLLVPAAFVSFLIGSFLAPALPPLMALIAGFFLYIAIQEFFGMIKESNKQEKTSHAEHH